MVAYAPPVGPNCRHLLPGSDFYSAVTGKADPNRAGPHAGLDLQPPIPGEAAEIYWLVGGTITRMVRTMVKGSLTHTGYAYHTGNYVEWQGDDGYIWHYRHMPQWAMKALKVGQRVTAGDLATYMGTTGNSKGVHLHLGCRDKRGRFIDPEPILRDNGVWPIGNDYYTKETPMSAEEVKQINAHTTAQANRIIKAIESIPADVWRYKVPNVATGEDTYMHTFMRWGFEKTNRVNARVLAVEGLVKEVAQRTGMSLEEVTKAVKEASYLASKEATEDAIASGVQIEGNVTLTKKEQ